MIRRYRLAPISATRKLFMNNFSGFAFTSTARNLVMTKFARTAGNLVMTKVFGWPRADQVMKLVP